MHVALKGVRHVPLAARVDYSLLRVGGTEWDYAREAHHGLLVSSCRRSGLVANERPGPFLSGRPWRRFGHVLAIGALPERATTTSITLGADVNHLRAENGPTPAAAPARTGGADHQGRPSMTHSGSNTLARLASIFLTSAAAVTLAPAAQAADQLLSGAVTSASREKLGGVTVSAR